MQPPAAGISFNHDCKFPFHYAARPDLGDGGTMRPVVDLLVEQIECADYIILNKIDQLDAAQLESLKGIASSLNPLSRVRAVKFPFTRMHSSS